jgi:hypothetical protein
VGVDDLASLFEFLLSCLDRFGRPASCLFAGFDVSLLDAEQFKRLDGRSDFDWCFVADSMRVRLSGLFEKVSGIESRLAQAERRFEAEVVQMDRRFTAQLAELEGRLKTQGLETDHQIKAQLAELRLHVDNGDGSLGGALTNLRDIVTDLVDGTDDEHVRQFKAQVNFPLKHVLLPRGHEFQIRTDCARSPQALSVANTAPAWASGYPPPTRAIELAPSNPRDPRQQFYFRDTKCRVIAWIPQVSDTSSEFVEAILDEPSCHELYVIPGPGNPNQSFWFDGEFLFVLSSGHVVTIDENHPYHVRLCKLERNPCQRFSLELIPAE